MPTLDACANVLLGVEASRLGFLRTRDQRAAARGLLDELGFEASTTVPAGTLRPADLQLIEIAKALFGRPSVVIMDEPTAALGIAEREHMLSVVTGLRARGVGVLHIAHDLDEVLAVSDRVTVMRDGRTVTTVEASATTTGELVELMVGAHVTLLERVSSEVGEVLLRLDGVSQGDQLRRVTLTCRAGEILGVTGLVGSGRTRLLNVIAGLEQTTAGTMSLAGDSYAPASPRDALSRGVALVPENRKRESLLMDLPSTESIMLAEPISRAGLLRRRPERSKAQSLMSLLEVKPANPSVTPASMSGGNQQKVAIAKALQSEARVLMLDEPGQGVDIAAKSQIYRSMRTLATEGRAILIVSSELAGTMSQHSVPTRTALLAGAAGLVLAVSGCGSSSSDAGGATSASAPLKGKTVIYIQTGSIPYYEYTKKGFEAAVTKLGGTPKTVNSNFDASAELANVQNAITQKVDAVVLEPLSSATVKAELRLLDSAKIPTAVLYGYSDDLKDQAVGFQEAQNLDTGEAAGKKMAELVPSGDVAVITGTQGRSDVDGYNTGFKTGFGDDARVVETYNGNYDRKTAFNAAQDLITKHPDIKGVFVHNEDMAIGVIEALGSKANSVAIVTQNGSPDGVKYLQNGQIKASIGWSPTEEGAMSAQTLALHFENKDRSTKLCLTPYAVKTPQKPQTSVRWDDVSAVVAKGLTEKCADGSK